jgi:hypothetical protein
MYRTALLTSVIGVLLNIILALMLSPFATASQIKPPNGASSLDFFSQIMHMLVHHGQVLFTSSLIIFALVFLSTVIADQLQ